jgi:holo-[acyl-carrier protein] synthase
MIIGSGIDLAEVERIQHSTDRYGKRFLDRIYTAGEQAYCLGRRNSAESLLHALQPRKRAPRPLGQASAEESTGWKSRWSASPAEGRRSGFTDVQRRLPNEWGW